MIEKQKNSERVLEKERDMKTNEHTYINQPHATVRRYLLY